jgi:hypothetical protein
VGLEIESEGVALGVLGCHERRAATHERIENELTLVREELYDPRGKRNRKSRRMKILVSDVSALIEKLPDPKLTLQPFFGGQAVEVVGRAGTGALHPVQIRNNFGSGQNVWLLCAVGSLIGVYFP